MNPVFIFVFQLAFLTCVLKMVEVKDPVGMKVCYEKSRALSVARVTKVGHSVK